MYDLLEAAEGLTVLPAGSTAEMEGAFAAPRTSSDLNAATGFTVGAGGGRASMEKRNAAGTVFDADEH